MMLFFLAICLLVATSTYAFIPLGSPNRPQSSHLQAGTTSDDAAFMDALRQRLGAGPFRLIDTTATTANTAPSLYYIIKIAHKGVHSIEYPQGSGNNVVLAFCDAAACRKFAASLREQSFFDPVVQSIIPTTLHDFCQRQGVYYHTVPEGVELIPPKHTVKEIGRHNTDRSFREQLNYVYGMTVEELEDDGVIFPATIMDDSSSSMVVGAFE